MPDPLPSPDVVFRRVANTSLSLPGRTAELAGRVMQIAIPALMAGTGYLAAGCQGAIKAVACSVFLLMAPAFFRNLRRLPPSGDTPVDTDDPEAGYPTDFRNTPDPLRMRREDSDYRSEKASGCRSPAPPRKRAEQAGRILIFVLPTFLSGVGYLVAGIPGSVGGFWWFTLMLAAAPVLRGRALQFTASPPDPETGRGYPTDFRYAPENPP
ncbi:MAG: hypothetical protein OXF02_05195 [Simkaniaceae bacterium]|nr:hypothetical protein [Simkaniaceae bacterium]